MIEKHKGIFEKFNFKNSMFTVARVWLPTEKCAWYSPLVWGTTVVVTDDLVLSL
jgi:hypothetical protein